MQTSFAETDVQLCVDSVFAVVLELHSYNMPVFSAEADLQLCVYAEFQSDSCNYMTDVLHCTVGWQSKCRCVLQKPIYNYV